MQKMKLHIPLKIFLLSTLVFIILFMFTSPSFAERPMSRLDPGSNSCRIFTLERLRQGGKIFSGSCKSCHSAEADRGAESILYPRAYSPGDWTRIFYLRYPKCAQNGSWDKLSEDDVTLLADYLFRGGWGTWDNFSREEFC